MAKDSTDRNASTDTLRIGSMQQHGEALEKLAFSNILLTAVIESSPDGILVANNINKILTYNKKFLEMWNISPEDEASGINEKLLMQKAQALKDPERYVENIRLQHANSNKDSRYETEFKDGRVFEESTRAAQSGRIYRPHMVLP